MGKHGFDDWIDARKRFRLSDAHIQMARELGLNPKKFGKLANHKQEPWKAPLPEFIENCYFKAFGKTRPDEVCSIEALCERREKKQAERKARRKREKELAQRGESAQPDGTVAPPNPDDLYNDGDDDWQIPF